MYSQIYKRKAETPKPEVKTFPNHDAIAKMKEFSTEHQQGEKQEQRKAYSEGDMTLIMLIMLLLSDSDILPAVSILSLLML